MKTKLILILLFIGSIAIAQPTIYASFLPVELGYGVRYDKDNMYVSISHGEYRLEGGNMEHGKLALGGVYFPPNGWFSTSRQEKSSSFVTCGVCLHDYNNQSLQEFKRIVTYPLSFELGAGTTINHFALAFRFDIIKNESVIDIGFKF